MADFHIEKTSTPTPADQREALLKDPKFGRVFTDHMVVIRYVEGQGWHDAKVVPRGPLSIDPASTVLHYGQEIFEGLKAYRGKNGDITLFRPEANAARFAASARRLAMAELPEDLFMGAIENLLKVDRDWVPQGSDQSLYLRPFMISNEVFLGVKRANEYLFVLLASPVGAYFSSGCVSVWVSDEYTRAAIGGTGEAKCGGNYASSLVPQQEAAEKGCDQVLFLDARERRYVDEMGGMNVMFVHKDGSVVTPPLSGAILRGITRDSLLKLGRKMGLTMREEPIAIDDVFAGAASGEIVEAFACGTAAVVSPIGSFHRASGDEARFGDGKTAGPVALRLREALSSVQRGEAEDSFHWVHHVTV